MNIKIRIKKIESELQLDADTCRCNKEINIKVEPRSETDELPPPKTCADCGKVQTERWMTFNFNSNIETELILPQYQVIEPGDEFHEEKTQMNIKNRIKKISDALRTQAETINSKPFLTLDQ